MTDEAEVQQIAQQAMKLTRASLRPGQTLADVRASCEARLLDLGADAFWYWGIGAFVFAGTGTIASVSGRDYRTPDHVLREDELVTLDLSPQRGGVWGDFARTLVIEDGVPLEDPAATSNEEWRSGILAERQLHAELREVAVPDMTFEELARRMNERVVALGYENLDFLGNLGHSIARASGDRVYIEPGNRARLDSVGSFTFEPHIRRPGGSYGYKHEDIYRFVDGRLSPL
ncbi:M24 family metallopeptidase [Brachybacterium sp. NBEC-018]|uniref:M24 family metallopeptidase n=1 Tax=Brachybacterium sp. NBEC-018 TaxID=2996004 RepID=UPI002174D934|nr:M24 family metallopeptidase [Brachybacterium sp. NBEC-018]UVY84722.1 M24 family metallopeptidase [Brachybacterium sp. NBEC-018]